MIKIMYSKMEFNASLPRAPDADISEYASLKSIISNINRHCGMPLCINALLGLATMGCKIPRAERS